MIISSPPGGRLSPTGRTRCLKSKYNNLCVQRDRSRSKWFGATEDRLLRKEKFPLELVASPAASSDSVKLKSVHQGAHLPRPAPTIAHQPRGTHSAAHLGDKHGGAAHRNGGVAGGLLPTTSTSTTCRLRPASQWPMSHRHGTPPTPCPGSRPPSHIGFLRSGGLSLLRFWSSRALELDPYDHVREAPRTKPRSRRSATAS